MKAAPCTLVLLLFASIALAQVSYDQTKVTSDTVVDFSVTKFRGIKTGDGMVYYLEQDHQTLTAYTKDKIRWQVNVIKTCAPTKVNAEIKYLYLLDTRLKLDIGTDSHAEVTIEEGNVICSFH